MLAVAPVKKSEPCPCCNIACRLPPVRKPAWQAISQTLRKTRSVVSRIGK
jgi:hypothetical protein